MCKYCNQPLIYSMDSSGGCMGHESGEYCYCDSIDWYMEAQCNTRGCRGKKDKFTISELGDRYAIERFLTTYLKEHPELVEQRTPTKKDRWGQWI